MTTRSGVLGSLVGWITACAVLALAAPVNAAVTYRDLLSSPNPERQMSGGRIHETVAGEGWIGGGDAWPHPGQEGYVSLPRVSYAIDNRSIPWREGKVELLLVNSSRNDDPNEADAVFELGSTQERVGLWAITINWNDPEGTVVGFEGRPLEHEQFGRYAVLPKIARGAVLHLVVSWDDSGLRRLVRGNGVEYPIVPMTDLVSLDDPGRVRPRATTEVGSLLKGADTVRLGILSSWPEFWPEGELPANDTTVVAWAMHDRAADEDVLQTGGGGLPSISEVSHDAFRKAGFSSRLVAGDSVRVTVSGTPGAAATFDVAHVVGVGGSLVLDWRGWGVYLEEKGYFEAGEVDLSKVRGYRVYVKTEPFGDPASAGAPVAELAPTEQAYTFENPPADKPLYAGVWAAMEDGTLRGIITPLVSLPLAEVSPGSYSGTYVVGFGQKYPEAAVVGRVATAGGAASAVASERFSVDPTLTVDVATSASELPADEKSQAKLTVTVKDANGRAVSGHKMKFFLATTSQYTGVVGGGAFTDEVGGAITESSYQETDLFGQVRATYVSGFAAKTAIVVARDMTSNDTGVAYIKTYITAEAQINLEPVSEALAAGGYAIAVTSSDSWLTADGQSQARITAQVTLNGQPVEGRRVVFSVSGGGTVRAVRDTTDRNGEARAVYTAGKKIGTATVVASDLEADVSGSVQIELRSDAPAKIAVRVDPPSLPADGRSRADLFVTVTDINDNPNEGVEVEYGLVSGGGSLREATTITDGRGESGTEYVAGRSAGVAVVEVTVRSTVPTEDELMQARALSLAAPDYRFR